MSSYVMIVIQTRCNLLLDLTEATKIRGGIGSF